MNEIIAELKELFTSIWGIIIASGISLSGIGYAVIRAIKPKTKHELFMESQVTSLSTANANLTARVNELENKLIAQGETFNSRLSQVASVAPSNKVRQLAFEWSEEDKKKAVEVAVQVAPVVVETGKKIITKLIKKK